MNLSSSVWYSSIKKELHSIFQNYNCPRSPLHLAFVHATKSARVNRALRCFVPFITWTEKLKKGGCFSAKNMQQTCTNRNLYKFWTTFGRGTEVDTQQKNRISSRFMTTWIGKLKSVLFTTADWGRYVSILTWWPVTLVSEPKRCASAWHTVWENLYVKNRRIYFCFRILGDSENFGSNLSRYISSNVMKFFTHVLTYVF